MTAVLEGVCTVLSGFLLFGTKGKELGVSWLLLAMFLGVFGSFETLHHSQLPFEDHLFLHTVSYLVFGWTGLILGLLLVDALVNIITFNTIVVLSYVTLSSVAQLRPHRLWFVSKLGIALCVATLGTLVTQRWPAQALHTCTVVLGSFLVASGVQLLLAHSASLVSSVTECAELVWTQPGASEPTDPRKACYPTYILWPIAAFIATSIRARRAAAASAAGLERPLLGESAAQLLSYDEWLPQLPTGLHGVQKAMKLVLFRVLPGCLRGCYNFLAMAEQVSSPAVH